MYHDRDDAVNGEPMKRRRTLASEWLLENRVGKPRFNAIANRQANHEIEEVGKRLRGMMSWINQEF